VETVDLSSVWPESARVHLRLTVVERLHLRVAVARLSELLRRQLGSYFVRYFALLTAHEHISGLKR
jgi:hypothetical protein